MRPFTLTTINKQQRLLHVHREDMYDNHFFLSVKFPRGSYFDKPGKEGTAHLLEHLVLSKKLIGAAKAKGVDINGLTDYNYVSLTISGPVGSKEFGLDAVLPEFLEMLLELEITSESLAKEISVVERELEREESNHEMVFHYRLLTRFLLDKKNPLRKNNLGSHESLSQITLVDLAEFFAELWATTGILLEVYTSGERAKFKDTIELIRAWATENLPGQIETTFPYANIDLTNKAAVGQEHAYASGTAEMCRLASVRVVSQVPSHNAKYELLKEVATRYISPAIWSELRKAGLVYTCRVKLFDLFDSTLVMTTLETSKQQQHEAADLLQQLEEKYFSQDYLIGQLSAARENLLLRGALLPIKPAEVFALNRRTVFERGITVDLSGRQEQLAGLTTSELEKLARQLQGQKSTKLTYCY